MDTSNIAPLFSLAGRTALIKGSSRGTGKAIAMTLGRACAKVVIHGASDSPALRAELADADEAGISHEVRFADIGSAAACDGLAASCAGPALALCLDTGAYITGAELVVDGGFSL